MEAPSSDGLVVVEEQLTHAVQYSTLWSGVVSIQRRERIETALAKLRAVPVGRVESVPAQ